MKCFWIIFIMHLTLFYKRVLHAVLQCILPLQAGKVALQKSHSSKLQDQNK